jgi:hypothetical protein
MWQAMSQGDQDHGHDGQTKGRSPRQKTQLAPGGPPGQEQTDANAAARRRQNEEKGWNIEKLAQATHFIPRSLA